MTTPISEKEHAVLVDKLASQCVKCALCLPHCPTYELTQDENESPRGRIALFQALAQEKLPLTEKAKSHLDQCLGCRACERVCPAHVEYGQLLTLGRALIPELPAKAPLKKLSLSTRFLSWVLTQNTMNRALQWVLWVLQKTGLRNVAHLIKLPSLLGIGTLESILPKVPPPLKLLPFYEALGPKQGSVSLFTGCLSSLCDQETTLASIWVLRHLGMDVTIPTNQTCCGAIATHAGDIQEAHRLAKQNCQVFLDQNIDYVVTTATGCSAVLQEYASHFSFSSDLKVNAFPAFSNKVTDIITFIQNHWPATLTLSPVKGLAILHTPCTRRNVLKSPRDPEQLLTKIPQLTYKTFTSPHCCGAAGTYMLEHPLIAEELAQNLLKDLANLEVNFIATTNIGCALHLNKEVKKRYPQVKVVHPIILLAKALGF
ncbi:MAG: (Fe-S)-binding protein [Proteobacteria bacterium]|nr:(Fe-S)-binding protein [Pseudomonadota bacterium]